MIFPVSAIICPHCGAQIEIEARPVQAELPLGPIELLDKKSLAKKVAESLQSSDSVQSDFPIENAAGNDSNRIDSSIVSGEDLIESVQRIVGAKEFEINGRLWHCYFRQSRRALAYAIEDWQLRTPDQQRTIKNRPAWLTDRYKRALAELDAGKKLRKMA
jgi:hypothetical protein